MKTLWDKLKSWLGIIPLTCICIILIVILVYFLKLPLKSFIESIQRGLRKSGNQAENAHATQISEENNSVVPEAPKNYKALGTESADSTEKVIRLLDQTLETLKNVKATP